MCSGMSNSMRVKVKVSRVRLCVTPWTIESMEFSRPEYWSGFPSPGDLPNPGIKPRSPALQAGFLPAKSNSVRPHRRQPIRLLCLWDFPGKNTSVGCHSLPQGIFPTQGSNLHVLHLQANSLPLSHQGSPRRIRSEDWM